VTFDCLTDDSEVVTTNREPIHAMHVSFFQTG